MATADGPLPDQAPTTTTTGSSVQKRASAAPVTTPRFQPSLRPEPQLHHYSVRTSPGVRCAPRRCPAGNVLPGEQPSGLRRLPTFPTPRFQPSTPQGPHPAERAKMGCQAVWYALSAKRGNRRGARDRSDALLLPGAQPSGPKRCNAQRGRPWDPVTTPRFQPSPPQGPHTAPHAQMGRQAVW